MGVGTMNIPCILQVSVIGKTCLRITFADGSIKIYDVYAQMPRLITSSNFDFYHSFNNVQIESGGVGVHWNEEISISRRELWENGRFENDNLEFD